MKKLMVALALATVTSTVAAQTISFGIHGSHGSFTYSSGYPVVMYPSTYFPRHHYRHFHPVAPPIYIPYAPPVYHQPVVIYEQPPQVIYRASKPELRLPLGESLSSTDCSSQYSRVCTFEGNMCIICN